MKTHTIDSPDLETMAHDDGSISSEASALGWRPGYVPDQIVCEDVTYAFDPGASTEEVFMFFEPGGPGCFKVFND